MVKNEADIIEESVQNLLDQDVDHVLIADNGSQDGTADLLRAMGERLPVHVVEDSIVPYWQGEKVSHLARAATRMGAAWVIPFDADELWKGSGGKTVAQVLRSTPEDYAIASWWDFMPMLAVGGSTFAERFPFRDPVSRPQVTVAFRAHWLARVWIGSHHVTVPRRTSQLEVLRIAHFPFRTPAQMVRKATDGARAARIAGENSADLPQWFGMEGATEAEAAA